MKPGSAPEARRAGAATRSRRVPPRMRAARRRPPSRASRRRRAAAARRVAPPLEHRMLMTATLCLLAFGAVMIYSASSPVGALSRRGGAARATFLRYVVFVGLGLGIMYVLERHGLAADDANGSCRLLLLGSGALLVLVLVPQLRRGGRGAGAGSPPGRSSSSRRRSTKLALVLYAAQKLADTRAAERAASRGRSPSPVAWSACPRVVLIVGRAGPRARRWWWRCDVCDAAGRRGHAGPVPAAHRRHRLVR